MFAGLRTLAYPGLFFLDSIGFVTAKSDKRSKLKRWSLGKCEQPLYSGAVFNTVKREKHSSTKDAELKIIENYKED